MICAKLLENFLASSEVRKVRCSRSYLCSQKFAPITNINNTMAGLKRKEAPISKPSGDKIRKKPKKEAPPLKKSKGTLQLQETETDSEPIVESDTTEQSGEDDGVNWPSDEDETTLELPVRNQKPHNEKVDETSDGGVQLRKELVAGRDGKNGRVL